MSAEAGFKKLEGCRRAEVRQANDVGGDALEFGHRLLGGFKITNRRDLDCVAICLCAC